MNLFEKLISLYPSIVKEDFLNKYIVLQNDSNGRGDYIAKWEHPTLPRPTDEELA